MNNFLISANRSLISNIILLRTKKCIHISAINVAKNSPHSGKIYQDVQRLRNIGIIAHINAGKTTTTERILYHAGSTDTVGDVDTGNTVTDYLIQERNRGITITSAAVSYNWNKHSVNLIDTPGHVDFTFEVERSLSVLDGVTTLIDASAGVEAQTVTVWNQAKKYKLPNIIFLNKYDKSQANYKMCINDLKKSLNIVPSLIQLPIYSTIDKRFSSIADIIDRRCISWLQPDKDYGNKFISEPAIESSLLDKKNLDLMEEVRESLVNKLCDFDDELASHVLECDKISQVSGEHIHKSLRKATLGCKISPVLLGSSFKCIGVQQLMNAIIDYLPSPFDREKQFSDLLSPSINDASKDTKSNKTCAFIFKIMHDKRLGPLSYVKMLNGSIERLKKVKNLEDGNLEQIKKIYRPFADELREVDHKVVKHDIVVLTGLATSKTGDILVDPSFETNDYDELSKKGNIEDEEMPFELLSMDSKILVPQINRMEPVYFCSIESKSSSQQLKLEHALTCLAREDPSFTYNIDQFGLTTIRGMGKLHLDVVRDRIESEYGIQPLLGPLQISYREAIKDSATEELEVERLINSVSNKLSIKIYVRSKPKAGIWKGKMLRIDLSGESTLGKLRSDHRKAIENGLLSGLAYGPAKGFPMIDCDILLLDFAANRRCSLAMISSVASQCLTNALRRCQPVLLEPIMLLEVVIPIEYNSNVLSDIANRRGIVESTVARNDGSTMVIRARTPLSSLSDYSEQLRIRTSGRGSFSMELHSYSEMSEADKRNIVRV